jgi:hypothetical protein
VGAGRYARVLALGVAGSLAAAGAAAGAMTTIQPSSQDAYVQKDKPNRITGAGPNHTRIRIEASPPNTKVRRGFVQFDLSGIPGGSTVNSAILQLHEGNNPGSPVTHGVHRALAAWLQSAVKWNNQPPHDATPSATDLVPADTVREFRSFDVTADVQNFINFCSNDNGWVVKDQNETGSNEGVNYISREERQIPDIPKRPRLLVDFDPPPCGTDADCADGNFCTTAERCENGACVVDPVDCDDGDPCTDDLCDCDVGCINAPICNDGFACTLDTCDPATLACSSTVIPGACDTDCSTGTCVADPDRTDIDPVTGCLVTATAPDGTPCTPDAFPCTDDVCLVGSCAHPPAGAGEPCDDGNPCTTGDQCDGAGACGGSGTVCVPQSQCHLAGTCDPGTGECSNPPRPSGDPCDDGNACTTGDQCDGAGGCSPGAGTVCTAQSQCHLAGTCDPGTGECSNPPRPNGDPCDDGNLCTEDDRCDGAGGCDGSPVVCTPLGQCRVVGTCDPDTGQCSSPPGPDGEPCDDGNPCTVEDVCADGMCQGDLMTCGDGLVQETCGEECDDPDDPNCTPDCRLVCGPEPEAGCRQPALAGKGVLLLKDAALDRRDKLVWKWIKGSATAQQDLGDPLTDTHYLLCLYDESASPQPRLLAVIPPDRLCGTKPCWKRIKKGFKYRDKLLAPDGVQLVVLTFGPAPKAKIIVKGKGENLDPPALPLVPKVTMQLHNAAGVCWEAGYTNPKLNLPDRFKARAD